MSGPEDDETTAEILLNISERKKKKKRLVCYFQTNPLPGAGKVDQVRGKEKKSPSVIESGSSTNFQGLRKQF